MNLQKRCIYPNSQFSHKVYCKGQRAGNSTDGLFIPFETAAFMGDGVAHQLKAPSMTAGFERAAHADPFYYILT